MLFTQRCSLKQPFAVLQQLQLPAEGLGYCMLLVVWQMGGPHVAHAACGICWLLSTGAFSAAVWHKSLLVVLKGRMVIECLSYWGPDVAEHRFVRILGFVLWVAHVYQALYGIGVPV